MPLDSVSTPQIIEELPFKGRIFWAVNGQDTDASTAIEIQAAPGAGLALYLEQIFLGSDDADAHPHLQDEDDNVLFGPLMSTVEGPGIGGILKHPIKLVSNKALEIKAAAAGNVFVYVQGVIAAG